MIDACKSSPTRDGLEVVESASGVSRVAGYACVFGRWATLHADDRVEYRELIAPGAFSASLAEHRKSMKGRDDPERLFEDSVKVLRDYEGGRMLASDGVGTLSIVEDERGVRVDFKPPGLRPGVEVRELVRDGRASLSLAYRIREGGERRTTREEDGRTIHESVVEAADLVAVGFITPDVYKHPALFLQNRRMIDRAELKRIRMQALDLLFAEAEVKRHEAEASARSRAMAERERAAAGIGWRGEDEGGASGVAG